MKRTAALAGALGVIVIVCPQTARAARCSDGRDEKEDKSGTATEPTREECIERDIFFMPGAYGVFYQPHGAHAPFGGAGVEIAPFQWSHNNDRFGPSQGSMYMGVALLQSPRERGSMTLFELGATASFERNASRRWLIPYFGANLGGMTQSQLGPSAYVYPLGGAHLYWHRNLMIDTEGGYHFPFADVDRARGPRAQLTARFSLW